MESVGINEIIYNSIMKCDRDLHVPLFNNIIICGGTSLLPGLNNRLQEELNKLITTAEANFKFITLPTRDNAHMSWIGGSLLGSLSTFKNMLFLKDEYDEFGTKLIHRKCF